MESTNILDNVGSPWLFFQAQCIAETSAACTSSSLVNLDLQKRVCGFLRFEDFTQLLSRQWCEHYKRLQFLHTMPNRFSLYIIFSRVYSRTSAVDLGFSCLICPFQAQSPNDEKDEHYGSYHQAEEGKVRS